MKYIHCDNGINYSIDQRYIFVFKTRTIHNTIGFQYDDYCSNSKILFVLQKTEINDDTP